MRHVWITLWRKWFVVTWSSCRTFWAAQPDHRNLKLPDSESLGQGAERKTLADCQMNLNIAAHTLGGFQSRGNIFVEGVCQHMLLWLRKRALTRFTKVTWRRGSQSCCSKLFSHRTHRDSHNDRVCLRGRWTLWHDSSLPCGIYTDCSLKQRVWRVFSVTEQNLLFVANIVLLWFGDSCV